MKKKIILFLTFLTLILCLTGCTQEKTVTGDKIDEMTQIANNVVNQKGYELPAGYEVSFPDKTTNARIKITDNTKSPKEYLKIVFDVSKDKIELVEISTGTLIYVNIVCVILGIIGISCIVYVTASSMYKSIKKRRRIREKEQ